ncbi:hypothetical protein L2E82_10841 [Cichorium intybus]|uniref:Uncharacterized protein n=1 Tax=Cichorium intybus TaxID=13427 RepID=A0ACB9GBJ1_CICIN|nr:hypothetical protein L2E82_10841 [Cichorium intybus]
MRFWLFRVTRSIQAFSYPFRFESQFSCLYCLFIHGKNAELALHFMEYFKEQKLNPPKKFEGYFFSSFFVSIVGIKIKQERDINEVKTCGSSIGAFFLLSKAETTTLFLTS